MTREEIKNKYGNESGYICCDKCPLYHLSPDCSDIYAHSTKCDGYDVAYRAIAAYMNSEETKEVKEDVVNHPNHYTNGGMECFDEMLMVFGEEAVANFCLCNAWKYRYRALYKNGEEDIKKSHWYMNKYKELNSNE